MSLLLHLPHNNLIGIVASCGCTAGVNVTIGQGMPWGACPEFYRCRGAARINIEQARQLLYRVGAAGRDLFNAIEASEALMSLKVGG